jgi:hypothetical protein
LRAGVFDLQAGRSDGDKIITKTSTFLIHIKWYGNDAGMMRQGPVDRQRGNLSRLEGNPHREVRKYLLGIYIVDSPRALKRSMPRG